MQTALSPAPPDSRFRRAVDWPRQRNLLTARRPGGRVGGELVLEALPPIGLGLCGPVRLPLCRLVRVELAEDDARLDRPVPVVDLEPHRGVDGVLGSDAELRAAEGDPERPVGARVEVEPRMLALLPHRPHVTHARRRDEQPHAGVAHPERRQPAELLGEIEAEVGAADHRVDPLRSHQVLGAEHLGGVGGERLAEGVEALRLERQAGGRPVPAEAGQVLGACLQRGEQVEAGDAAPRAPSPALAVERDDDRRPVVALDHPRGDDPDHSRVPALSGHDQSRRLAQRIRQIAKGRLGLVRHLPLRGPALAVGPAQLMRDLRRSRGVVGQEQLDSRVGPVQPSRRVDARSQPEREVALVHPSRLAFGRLRERLHPWPAQQPQLLQPALDQRPVLTHQGDDIRDRSQRHESRGPWCGWSGSWPTPPSTRN